jgi:hypothetical protein
MLSPSLCPRDPVPGQRSNQVLPLTAPTRGEAGTNYPGQAVWKGSRSPTE